MSGAGISTFGSEKKFLSEILKHIGSGKIQLPDFQRGWVWDDDHIKSLLASISLSFPVGTIMLLQTGNADVQFKPRLIEGVELSAPTAPELLILDGQQRLTALYQSLLSKTVVETRDSRKKHIKRWYYIDMRKALDPSIDREEAIVSIPESRKVLNFRAEVQEDYSQPEFEFKAHLFPCERIFDASSWRTQYQEYWDYKPEYTKLYDQFEREIVSRFDKYQMPVIELYKETPREAVCLVFEKVNTGGVSLTVFELLTATFAAENFDLRADAAARSKRWNKERLNILQGVENDDFLQGIALLTTWQQQQDSRGRSRSEIPGISCKRKDILALRKADYVQWKDALAEGFEKAARLLRSEKVFFSRDLPYRTQLVPLAAVFAVLGSEADKDLTRRKLIRWYWCGVLGELYSSSVETRFAKDLPELLVWIKGGAEPGTVSEATFSLNRMLTLKTRNSAAYKGISAMLLRDGGQDFRTGERVEEQMYADDKIDIHHIFPADWCDKNGIDVHRRDCIVNKTPLSAKTNRTISNKAPSMYIPKIEEEIDSDRMDAILRSHLIDSAYLRADDFNSFFEARREALLKRIESVMEKSIPRDTPTKYDAPEEFDLEEEPLDV